MTRRKRLASPLPRSSCGKSRRKLLEMIQHCPEQPFSERSIAALIGVGKIVTAGRSRPAQGRKWTAVQPQRITDVIQTDGVGQLRKEHADHMTPGAKGSRHAIHAGLPRKFRHQVRRNQIAKLPENSEFGCGWFGVSFHHLCRVTKLKSHANHFSFRPLWRFLWDGCDLDRIVADDFILIKLKGGTEVTKASLVAAEA